MQLLRRSNYSTSLQARMAQTGDVAENVAPYVGAIVCKLDYHKTGVRRGYIAMLAVDERFRRRQIGQ